MLKKLTKPFLIQKIHSNIMKEIREWDSNKKYTSVIRKYHENGNISYEYEWDSNKKYTSVIRKYHENGNISYECEWNSDKKYTRIIRKYHENGNISYKRI